MHAYVSAMKPEDMLESAPLRHTSHRIKNKQVVAVTGAVGSPRLSYRSCPFRTEGLWEDGEFIRSSTLAVDFVGVTGDVKFKGGDNLVSNGAGTAGSGWREANGTTFCALNLQAHASLGATFATMSSYEPEQQSDINGTAPFEVGKLAVGGEWSYLLATSVLFRRWV